MKDNNDKLLPLDPDDEVLGKVLSNGLPGLEAGRCPSSEEIAAFLEGRLSGDKRDKLLLHLSSCSNCCEVFFLAADLHKERQGEIKKGRSHAVIFRPLALAASILVVIFSFYLFFKTDVPKTPDALVETRESAARSEALADQERAKALPEPAAPRRTGADSKFQEADSSRLPGVHGGYTMPKAKKGPPPGAGEDRGKIPPAEEVKKEDTFRRRGTLEKAGKKADKMFILKDQEEEIPADEIQEMEKSLGGSAAAEPKASQPAPPPAKLKTASPLGKKETMARQQDKREAFRDKPVLQEAGLESGRTNALEKNRAWSQANLLNQQAQVYTAPIPASELNEMFKQSIDLTNQLKEPFAKLKQEAAETGNLKKVEEFVQGVAPLITIKSSKDADYIHPNIGYFLSRSIPGSLEYHFFNLARSGWCQPQGECYNLVKKEGLVSKVKTEQTAAVTNEGGENQLMQWETLYPQLSGVYREIASRTIENLKQQQTPALKGRIKN